MIKSFAVTNNLNERLDLVLKDPEQSGIVVKSVSGLGPGKATLHINEIANGDGGSYGGARTPVRNIVMDLVFLGNPTIEDTRQMTYRFFPTKHPIILTVVTDNLEVNIDGYVESNEPDIFSNLEGCQISILCENPYFYTERDQITTSSGIFPMLEFPIDNELIEDPTTERRIPSDEPYLEYKNIVAFQWSNLYIKYTPFNYTIPGEFDWDPYEGVSKPRVLYDVTTEDTSGHLPYRVEGHFKNGTEIFPRTCMFFWLNMASFNNIYENDKKYTLSFLVDGRFLDYLNASGRYNVLDIEVSANGVLLYNSGYRHKYIDGYEDFPVDIIKPGEISREGTKNRKIYIPLTSSAIENINKSNGYLLFKSKISFASSPHSIPDEYAQVYPDLYTMTIHDVKVCENNVETRSGFADEEINIYQWGVNYGILLDYREDYSSMLLFNVVKDKMDWENKDDAWKPRSDDGRRMFTLEFDVNASIEIKNNGNANKDYLSLVIETEKIYEVVDVCGIPVNNDTTNTIKGLKINITEDAYYNLLYNMRDVYYGNYLTFKALYNRYNSLNNSYKTENPGRHYTDNTPDTEDYPYTDNVVEVSNIKFYEVLQPTTDQSILNRINYLVDDSMPDYAFEKDGKNYNLMASEGIIMGEIQKYGFTHLIRYEGSASIGFQITIGFSHSLALFNNSGLVGNPGYIIITSNFYPRKKMVIDLKKVYEIVQSSGDSGGKVIPITQPGDFIFIDTRKKRKAIRYQKPYDYTYTNSSGESILWDHAGYKINVLAASNRDIEWFEIFQGDNILTIRHASDPDMEDESELENDHSEYLEVEVRNKIYYEGV